ncbi:carbohydrate kinase family protein [Actinomadura rubrisoli]|uniref:Carbohydrate kinase n=1 Tax=Actinomadura rubrisoli TaxID=2530368 RepID=A0A4R5CA92_9ACTN|nr:carbohydrate kinase [Actinomadura rubrisoli]TDD93952.1 carbohydrate kinase [Actinomadura rubrisoli]
MARILVFGEALVDLVGDPGGRRFRADPGGSPANVAVGLGRLGNAVTLVTGLGDDAFGRLVTGHLTASGVTPDVRPAPFTPLAVVSVDDQGVPSYDFALSWTPSAPAMPPDTAVLCTGSLAAALAEGPVEAAMAGAPAVAYDPNIRPPLLGDRASERRRVERQVALSDVVKASDEDLAWLYPGADPVEIAHRWRRLGPALVAVTRGPRGCVAVTAAGQVERPAPPVEVADTVGAGDAFMSGLLSALLAAGLLDPARRADLAQAGATALSAPLATALASAAITCARPGADPPTGEELKTFL